MEALDGNAVAGKFVAAFGVEMTTAVTTCANCGRSSLVAELAAYLDAPGTVVRCRNCDNVLIVLAEIGDITCVGLPGVAAVEMAYVA
jgi:hypothetical protein